MIDLLSVRVEEESSMDSKSAGTGSVGATDFIEEDEDLLLLSDNAEPILVSRLGLLLEAVLLAQLLAEPEEILFRLLLNLDAPDTLSLDLTSHGKSNDIELSIVLT